jgi:hypothetical protein
MYNIPRFVIVEVKDCITLTIIFGEIPNEALGIGPG